MSGPASSLKHSNSSTSLNTVNNIPMWDSSDLNRHPPPLPLHPDSPVLSSSPTKPNQMFASLRSRTGSPVRQSLNPISNVNVEPNNAILQQLGKIHEVLKEVESTSKSSESTVKHAEKQVDSLYKRSKDNAVDLISLRDKIYSTEILLSHQLQEIHDVISAVNSGKEDKQLQIAPSQEYIAQIDHLRKLMERTHSPSPEYLAKIEEYAVATKKEISSVKFAFETIASQNLQEIQNISHSHSRTDREMAMKLGTITTIIQALKSGIENGESMTAIWAKALEQFDELKQLYSEDHRFDEILRAVNGIQVAVRSDNMEGQSDTYKIEQLNASIQQLILEHGVSVSVQFDGVNKNLSFIKDGIVEANKTMSSEFARTSNKQFSDRLLETRTELETQMRKSIQTMNDPINHITTAVEDLRSFVSARSDSTLESTMREHEKLDQILKDIGELSANIAPLSQLPEIHASYIESANQINAYMGSEHSKLMTEVESLRQQKSKLISDLATLDSTVRMRTEQLERLEERANKFQQRLVEHTIAKPSRPLMEVNDENRSLVSSFQRSSKAGLDILTESSAPEDDIKVTSKTNTKSYGALSRAHNGNASNATLGSWDASRSISGNSMGNRRMSWGKKISTMFSAGKENDFHASRKVGKGRSVSERLLHESIKYLINNPDKP